MFERNRNVRTHGRPNVSPLKAALFWGAVAWVLCALLAAAAMAAVNPEENTEYGWKWEQAVNPALCFAYTYPDQGNPYVRLTVSYHAGFEAWGVNLDVLDDPTFEEETSYDNTHVPITLDFPGVLRHDHDFTAFSSGRLLTYIPAPTRVITAMRELDWVHVSLNGRVIAVYSLAGASAAIESAYECATGVSL